MKDWRTYSPEMIRSLQQLFSASWFSKNLMPLPPLPTAGFSSAGNEKEVIASSNLALSVLNKIVAGQGILLFFSHADNSPLLFAISNSSIRGKGTIEVN